MEAEQHTSVFLFSVSLTGLALIDNGVNDQCGVEEPRGRWPTFKRWPLTHYLGRVDRSRAISRGAANCCQVAEYPPPSSRPRVTPSLGRCVQSASGG
jgi:hypothetical protein